MKPFFRQKLSILLTGERVFSDSTLIVSHMDSYQTVVISGVTFRIFSCRMEGVGTEAGGLGDGMVTCCLLEAHFLAWSLLTVDVWLYDCHMTVARGDSWATWDIGLRHLGVARQSAPIPGKRIRDLPQCLQFLLEIQVRDLWPLLLLRKRDQKQFIRTETTSYPNLRTLRDPWWMLRCELASWWNNSPRDPRSPERE